MDTSKQKLYTYGYRKIHPLVPDVPHEEWEYSLQLHKNQNGKHWDLRFRRPGEDKAFSWAMKRFTSVGPKPVLAMRTHDHNIEHMDFEGPLVTAAGEGHVQLVERGTVKVKSIDPKGIQFEMKGKDYRLRPFKGRRYMFEQVTY